MSKPFISARIPESVNTAIEKRANETGESRTDILLNALKDYLKGDIKAPKSIDERLSALEKKFAEFQERFSLPKQTTLLDNIADNKVDNSTEEEPRNQLSHNTVTEVIESDNINENSFDNSKRGEWTNKQLEAVGISRSTVEGRLKKGKLPYNKNGITVHKRLRKEKRGRYTVSIWEVSRGN